MIRRPPRSTLDARRQRQMCIRDSDKVSQAVKQLPADIDAPPVVSKADANADAIIILAVSYTHLRAHETVLDLVCRLLLEKKK